MRACPVCDTRNIQVMRVFQFALPDNYPLPDHYNVVACNWCGMVYADTEATQADYDRFYREWNKYATRYEGTLDSTSAMSADRIAGHVLPSARVLDVGCANGELLSILRDKHGFTNTVGIDPSSQCADNGNKNGLKILTGTLSSLPDGIGKFDCIVLTHVVEHILDVFGAIKTVKGLLRPQGIIYIEVPDAGAQYAVSDTGPYQEINTEHINYFSEQCLRNLASVHSLRAISAGTAESKEMHIAYLVADASSAVPMKKDKALIEKIAAYLDESERLMSALCANLAQDLEGHNEVIAWGAGELTMKMLRLKPLRDKKIAAIVDGNTVKQGRKLGGIKVISPDAIKKPDLPIAIISVIHADSIKRTIAIGKIQNPIVELRA